MCKRLGWDSRWRKKKKKSTEMLEDGKETFVVKQKRQKRKANRLELLTLAFFPF